MMYLKYFGLSEQPFTLTPNMHFFLELTPHREALEVLRASLHEGEGFIIVTGEVGTGKTLICRKIMHELTDQQVRIYLPNPYLTPNELRWAVALELGLTYKDDLAQQQLTAMIQERLISLHQQGKKAVLFVDEAQSLPLDSLEALRLFTNLETETHKLLQVVLFGQPELNQRLQQYELRQLRQRITFSYHFRPLSESEVQSYIHYRLQAACYKGQPLFGRTDLKALFKALFKAYQGTPRLVNVIAHKALILSYGLGQNYVGHQQVTQAIQDTEGADTDSIFSKNILVFAVFGCALVGLLLGGLL